MNKSSYYNSLSIRVVSKSPSTVTYTLAHAMHGRHFVWSAKTGKDLVVLDGLEIGRRYFIRTETDKYGTQHWLEAKATDVPKPVVSSKPKPRTHEELADFVRF